MKAERIEDLGKIAILLSKLIEQAEDDWGHRANSKHTIDEFLTHYNDSRNLEDLHDQLRWHKEKLEEIYNIAAGFDYVDE